MSVPKHFRHFPGQKGTEQIRLLVRKHWISDVKLALLFCVLGLIPLGVYIFFVLGFWPSEVQDIHFIVLLAFLLYLLFAFLVTYIKWLNEELDVIIVTTERLIGHDQVDFFHKQVTEADISQIQDVRGVEKGFLGSIFHFGELVIKTAADKVAFEIKGVPHPYEIARKILDIRDKHMDDERAATHDSPIQF